MSKDLFNRLVIFEMANNHMGDVQHGLRIIRAIHALSKNFELFTFAFKFQYRDLDTFIHPDYRNRMDHKYVKRFSETRLTEEEFLMLKHEAERLGFMTICTPFDEASVDQVVKHGYDVLKIASASCTDWLLLEKIAATDLPIIVSTGGAKLEDVDSIVSFLQHRDKQFAIMHCVGEYPTLPERLQLNQIELYRQRYGVPVGFSTHEEPNNVEAIEIAVAKGAAIFEKHVGIATDQYELNAYSATPAQVWRWLQAATDACLMCGVSGERHVFSDKELADIHQFQRGAFASRDIEAGERITSANAFFAFPNQPGQMIANDFSKYVAFTAKEKIVRNAPILNVNKIDVREKVYAICRKAQELLAAAGIKLDKRLDVEISHHYGIDRFDEIGAVIVTCVNRAYAKKLILVFPGQEHPTHYHAKKEETFNVLYGDVEFILNDERIVVYAGDPAVLVEPGVRHGFTSINGAIFEEISSTHLGSVDSFYDDAAIAANHRKTSITNWAN